MIVKLQNKRKMISSKHAHPFNTNINIQQAPNAFTLPFCADMSITDMCKLNIGDVVDHRDECGRFVSCTVLEKQGSNLKLCYGCDYYDASFDIWCNYKLEPDRFAAAGSISRRKSYKFAHLKKYDKIKINPLRKHPGWKHGEITKLDTKSGQVQVAYELATGKRYLYWTHLDDITEIKCAENNRNYNQDDQTLWSLHEKELFFQAFTLNVGDKLDFRHIEGKPHDQIIQIPPIVEMNDRESDEGLFAEIKQQYFEYKQKQSQQLKFWKRAERWMIYHQQRDLLDTYMKEIADIENKIKSLNEQLEMNTENMKTYVENGKVVRDQLKVKQMERDQYLAVLNQLQIEMNTIVNTGKKIENKMTETQKLINCVLKRQENKKILQKVCLQIQNNQEKFLQKQKEAKQKENEIITLRNQLAQIKKQLQHNIAKNDVIKLKLKTLKMLRLNKTLKEKIIIDENISTLTKIIVSDKREFKVLQTSLIISEKDTKMMQNIETLEAEIVRLQLRAEALSKKRMQIKTKSLVALENSLHLENNLHLLKQRSRKILYSLKTTQTVMIKLQETIHVYSDQLCDNEKIFEEQNEIVQSLFQKAKKLGPQIRKEDFPRNVANGNRVFTVKELQEARAKVKQEIKECEQKYIYYKQKYGSKKRKFKERECEGNNMALVSRKKRKLNDDRINSLMVENKRLRKELKLQNDCCSEWKRKYNKLKTKHKCNNKSENK